MRIADPLVQGGLPNNEAGHSGKLTPASAPVLIAGLLFSAGILLARCWWAMPGVIAVAFAISAGIAFFSARKSARTAWIPLSVAWLLLGFLLAEIQPGPDPQRQLSWIADNGGIHSVEGVVRRTTLVQTIRSGWSGSRRQREEHSESIDLQIENVDGKPVAGGLRGTVYAPVTSPFPTLECGDRLGVQVKMHLPERYLDPGVWDSTAWLRGQGIGVIGSMKADSVEKLPQPRRRWSRAAASCWLHSIQQKGSSRLLDFADATASSHLPGWLRLSREDAGMLSAMILGDRTYLDRQARVGFERTGSFHLLVVSGMHIAIFAGLIFAIAALLGIPDFWATILTILCSFGYALVTGFGAPVQRSFWMIALFLAARLFFRNRNSLNAIGFAALCLLAWNPAALAGASLQMTLLSVLAVAGIAIPIADHTFGPYLHAARNLDQIFLDARLAPRVAQFRVTLRLIAGRLRPLAGQRAAQRWFPFSVRFALRLLELLLVSATIEFAMTLPMAVYFHRVTLLALPVNILVVPLIALALPAALIAFAAILLVPGVAFLPAAAAAALLHSISGIVRLFGSMPAGNIRIPSPGSFAIAAGILLIGAAAWAAHNTRFPVLLPVTALAAAALCALYPHPLLYHRGTLEITGIDVGQGDSILAVTPEGKTLLIDAGGPLGGWESSSTSNFDIGEDVVSPLLWQRHIRRLDAVELTHAHSDHMGGMPAVLRNFRPKELWVGKNPDTPAYDALLQEARDLGIAVKSWAAGDAFDFGGAHIEVLSPARDYVPESRPTNDDSLVLRITYGQTSALLEGDAERRSEDRMLGEDLRSDLLKVGHHGSNTSTNPAFLAKVDPRFALISVGHRNPYGHPRYIVLERLQDDRVLTFRTDDLGATSFYLNGKTVRADPLAAKASKSP